MLFRLSTRLPAPRALSDMAPSLGPQGDLYCSVCRLPFLHPASPVPKSLKLDDDARAHLSSAAHFSSARFRCVTSCPSMRVRTRELTAADQCFSREPNDAMEVIAARLEPPNDSRGSFICHHSCTLVFPLIGLELTDTTARNGLALAHFAFQIDSGKDGAVLGLLENGRPSVRVSDRKHDYQRVSWAAAAASTEVAKRFAHPDKPGGEAARAWRQGQLDVIVPCLSRRRRTLGAREVELVHRHRDPFDRSLMSPGDADTHDKRVADITAALRKIVPDFDWPDGDESFGTGSADYPLMITPMGLCAIAQLRAMLTMADAAEWLDRSLNSFYQFWSPRLYNTPKPGPDCCAYLGCGKPGATARCSRCRVLYCKRVYPALDPLT